MYGAGAGVARGVGAVPGVAQLELEKPELFEKLARFVTGKLELCLKLAQFELCSGWRVGA